MRNESMYRVFISYSHQDLNLVLRIAEILQDNGLTPMWDRNFAHGHGFHEQIKNFIAHAHVFLPVITPGADERKWVHQEIGYAMALNVPVLPLAVGKQPGEMIQLIHAIKVSEDLKQLQQHLTRKAIETLVSRFSDRSYALFQCADYPEERAVMMAKYCNDVLSLGFHDVVRQKGALSSFHLPDKAITNSVWQARHETKPRSPYHCKLQREERIALDNHARVAGCRLIINPDLTFELFGPSSRMVRLECLLEFLKSIPDDLCQVAINNKMDNNISVTILGDWFAAESLSASVSQGYRQTIFTRHAPSMMNSITSFDQEFSELLVAAGWTAKDSRAKTIKEIQRRLSKSKSC